MARRSAAAPAAVDRSSVGAGRSGAADDRRILGAFVAWAITAASSGRPALPASDSRSGKPQRSCRANRRRKIPRDPSPRQPKTGPGCLVDLVRAEHTDVVAAADVAQRRERAAVDLAVEFAADGGLLRAVVGADREDAGSRVGRHGRVGGAAKDRRGRGSHRLVYQGIGGVEERLGEIDLAVEPLLLDLRQQVGGPAPARLVVTGDGGIVPRPHAAPAGGKPPGMIVKVVQGHADLVQVALALHRPAALPRRLHRRQQQADERADDRDHHQQLDQRERPVGGNGDARRGPRRGRHLPGERTRRWRHGVHNPFEKGGAESGGWMVVHWRGLVHE